MESVVVAYDNAPETALRTFFESCSDDIKQECINNKHTYSNVSPPNLIHKNVVDVMVVNTICFVVAHGDCNGIYNEVNDAIISTHTANYNLRDKVFYSISCFCGINLGPQLKSIGVSLFVGYKDVFILGSNEDSFRIASTSGLKAILENKSFIEAKKIMLDSYDACISNASYQDAIYLLHNKENLCFE